MNVFLKDKTAVQVTNDKIVLSKYTNVFIGKHSDMNGAGKTSLYIGYDANDTSDKRPIYGDNVDGKPETVIAKKTADIPGTPGTPEVKETVKNTYYDMQEINGNVDAETENMCNAINGQALVDVTKTGNPHKAAYNKAFGDFINAATILDDSAMTKAMSAMDKELGGKS
jgi:hypothetical protein